MPEEIYISSTYQDLQDFREGAFKCIMGFQGHYQPQGMELYYAEDVGALDKCLTDVRACDIYLLILGRRYGSVFDGQTLSVTEMEYDTAVAANKPILVFDLGSMSKEYKYKETDPDLAAKLKAFKQKVRDHRLIGKPFNSIAELQFQISIALSRRLFKYLKDNTEIILPDEDSMCYCDRQSQINGLRNGVTKLRKNVFFVSANRVDDIPPFLVKRFAKYNLGSFSKMEPLNNLCALFPSMGDQNFAEAYLNMLEILHKDPPDDEDLDDEMLGARGFLKTLSEDKSKKVILPFYYDTSFNDEKKLTQFMRLLDEIYFEFHQFPDKDFQLYVLVFLYVQNASSDDHAAIEAIIQNEENGIRDELKSYIRFLEPLGPIHNHDIKDWLEKFWTSADRSSRLFNAYFEAEAGTRSMQTTSEKVDKMLEDITNGKKETINLLNIEN